MNEETIKKNLQEIVDYFYGSTDNAMAANALSKELSKIIDDYLEKRKGN